MQGNQLQNNLLMQGNNLDFMREMNIQNWGNQFEMQQRNFDQQKAMAQYYQEMRGYATPATVMGLSVAHQNSNHVTNLDTQPADGRTYYNQLNNSSSSSSDISSVNSARNYNVSGIPQHNYSGTGSSSSGASSITNPYDYPRMDDFASGASSSSSNQSSHAGSQFSSDNSNMSYDTASQGSSTTTDSDQSLLDFIKANPTNPKASEPQPLNRGNTIDFSQPGGTPVNSIRIGK